MVDVLSREQFAACLNSSFSLDWAGGPGLDLQLTQVSDLRATPKQEIFSILLRGPADRLLPQGIYNLAHQRMGRFDLFLVPVARDGDGAYYEAVFNRLIAAT